MANEVVKVTEVTNVITASLNDGSFNLLAGGTIGGNLQLGGTLTVGANTSGHDVKFFGDGSGKYFQWDASENKALINGNLTLAGDLDVTGTTTSFNSTVVTIDDPVFTIGGDTAPSSDDNKDRGIEFRYHDGSTARVGFFGYDDSESAFTFLTSATNSSEVFSGTLGNLKVNTVYHADGTEASPSVRFNLDTDTGIFRPTANNIAITAGGTEVIRFDGNLKTTTKGSVRVNGSTTEGIVIASSSTASQGLKLFNNSSTDAASIINHYNGSLILGTSNTERLRIHGDGNITIGGTAGQAMLQLEGGDVRVDNTRSFLTETAGGGVIAAVSMNSSDNLTFGDGNFVIDVTGTAERMRLDSSGRLIITNSAPVVQLIESDATSTFNNTEISLSGGSLNLNTRQSDGTFVSTDYQISKNASGATIHKFLIAGTEKAQINASGVSITDNLTLSYAYPRINLTDTNNDSDFSIINNDGSFGIFDVTNGVFRFLIDPNG